MNINDLVLPPHHIEAEKWVLCCVLLDNDNMSIVEELWINEDCFYQRQHRIIMENMRALRFTGRSIDIVTLTDCIWEDIHKIWGQEYLLELSVYLLTASVCREYCEILKDKRLRRQVISLTTKVSASCYWDSKINAIISRTILRLTDMNKENIVGDEDKVRFYQQADLITWWNENINNTFWYACNDLIVVVAEPWMGKTEWTCHVASENGRLWKKVLYYSLELSPSKLKQRSSYAKVWLSKAQFQRGDYDKRLNDVIEKNYEEFDKFFDLTWNQSMQDIDVLLSNIEAKAKEWYELIIIDNLWKVRREWHKDLEVEIRLTSDLQNLKNKYKHLNIILVHHQWKVKDRASEWMASVRWSQKIWDNATIMIQIWRDKDPDLNDEDKSRVSLLQFKDTEWGVIAKSDIYFRNGKYYDTYSI